MPSMALVSFTVTEASFAFEREQNSFQHHDSFEMGILLD